MYDHFKGFFNKQCKEKHTNVMDKNIHWGMNGKSFETSISLSSDTSCVSSSISDQQSINVQKTCGKRPNIVSEIIWK